MIPFRLAWVVSAPKENPSEGDYMHLTQCKKMRRQASAFSLRLIWCLTLVSTVLARTMPRRLTDGHVLDSICENRGSFGYESEVSLLVESQLSLDLEGLFSRTGLSRTPN